MSIQRWGHGRDGFVGWKIAMGFGDEFKSNWYCDFHYVKKKSVKHCWSLAGKKIANNKTHISYEYKIWTNNIFNSYPFFGELTYYPPFIKACLSWWSRSQGLSWVESLQLHVVSHKLRWEFASRVEVRDGIVSYITCMIRLITGLLGLRNFQKICKLCAWIIHESQIHSAELCP